LDPSDLECSDCPSNAVCNGGFEIDVDSGIIFFHQKILIFFKNKKL